MRDDRVVIFGGDGFIGRELCRQLSPVVSSIKVVSRGSARRSVNNIQTVRGDVLEAGVVSEVLSGATLVYQLTVEGDYLRGATNVAEACLAHSVRRLIYASTSDAMYLGGTKPATEAEGPDSKPYLRNEYSCGKAQSELLLRRMHEERGLPVVIVRPCLVVGRGGKLTHGGIGKWSTPLHLLGWGDGKNPLPFVLVEDVASALVAAADAEGVDGMTFSLAGDVRPTAREYVEMLRQETLREFQFITRDLRLFYLKVLFKTLLKKAVRGTGTIHHYRDMISASMRSPISNDAAKRWLGWTPVADREEFVKRAVRVHVEPFVPGDLRLS